MKIGLVLDDRLDVSDGVQQYVRTVGQWLTSQGHEVRYLVGEADGTATDVLGLSKTIGVAFNKNRVRVPLPANKERVQSILEANDLDVLHVQMPYAPWLAGRVMRTANAKTAVVGTFHVVLSSRTLSSLTWLLRPIYVLSVRRIDAVCAVSKPAEQLMQTYLGVNGPIIPNTVDTSLFGRGKKLARFKDTKTNVVFLGRLVERKGAEYLLRAFARVADTKKHRLILLGDGPLRPKLELLADELGIREAVVFEGYIDEKDKPDYLASADISVFPSTGGESFGIVLLEAMAAGHGVVLAGNNPGYSTVLGDTPGSLFDPQNSKNFEGTLQRYLQDSSARNSLRAVQQKLLNLYDIETVGPQLVEMYTDALSTRRKVT